MKKYFSSAEFLRSLYFMHAVKKVTPLFRKHIHTVSYTLNTNFKNQVYNTSHFSRLDASVAYLPPIIWDGSSTGGSTHACEAQNRGTFVQINFYDSPGKYAMPPPPILVFSIPSKSSIANYTDTSVIIIIKDTVYTGHASISVTVTSELNTQTVGNYFSGNFNVSGTVSSGSILDSVSFSSTGTFTNMAYN